MAGLNNLISNTAQQTTTMPSWFDTAQQNVVSQAGTALSAAPTPQNTVAQGAVNQLSGPTNAFTQATGTLQNIATGAANPWITDTATGTVKPNTDTALGGLFQAQNQQLQQLMPNVTAPVTGANIASGNFGSLRGDTAYNKAIGDAIAQQNAAQYQAALQNQATGVNAASNAGNVAQQGINNALTVGQYQQASPFTNVSNYGKVIGGVQAPTTVSNQTQLSPLNQIAGVASLGSGVMDQLFGTSGSGNKTLANGQPNPAYIAPKSGLVGTGGIRQIISGLGGGVGSGLSVDAGGKITPGSYPLSDGGSITINADGSKVITNANGTVSNFDSQGNPTAEPLSPIPDGGLPVDPNPGNPDNPNPIPDYTGPGFENPTPETPDYTDPGYDTEY